MKAIAFRVRENLPVHVDVDDLVQAGMIGLLDAVTKYKPEKKVAFSSYAKHRIKGAILDSLRQIDWASRNMRRRHKQVEAVTRDLAAVLHRIPTETEIAAKMGVKIDQWRHMVMNLQHVGRVSASACYNERGELPPLADSPAQPETHPDRMYAQAQLRAMLGTALRTLPSRYQKVVALYYLRDLTMREIGAILRIGESRVSQIHKSALEKMGAALEALGLPSNGTR